VTTVREVATSFLLITYARPTVAGLGGGGRWQGGAKGFTAPFFVAFSLCGPAAMRCSRLLHHMHLLVPTWHSGVVKFVLLYFLQGST